MATYYDYLLGAIPTVFTGTTTTGLIATNTIETSVLIGALTTLPLIIHGLFIRTPTEPHTDTTTVKTLHTNHTTNPTTNPTGTQPEPPGTDTQPPHHTDT